MIPFGRPKNVVLRESDPGMLQSHLTRRIVQDQGLRHKTRLGEQTGKRSGKKLVIRQPIKKNIARCGDQKKFRSCTIIVFCTIPYLSGRFILRVSRSGTVSIDSRTFDVLNDVIINDVKSLRLSTSAFKPNVPLQTPEMTILVSLNIFRGSKNRTPKIRIHPKSGLLSVWISAEFIWMCYSDYNHKLGCSKNIFFVHLNPLMLTTCMHNLSDWWPELRTLS